MPREIEIEFTQTVTLIRRVKVKEDETEQEVIDQVMERLPLQVEADGQWAVETREV
ncbi:hypothetical protein [Saccharopolyspora griseoalba]|uniref:Uncharacterized protein n=1 Tax=Saccharopolyspora griseoalba TaxID=1431848 RepID=A0ABW2LQX4_9PSEU